MRVESVKCGTELKNKPKYFNYEVMSSIYMQGTERLPNNFNFLILRCLQPDVKLLILPDKICLKYIRFTPSEHKLYTLHIYDTSLLKIS